MKKNRQTRLAKTHSTHSNFGWANLAIAATDRFCAILESMMLRTICQLEIAGEEMAPYIVGAKGVTPIGSAGKWELALRRRSETDKALGTIWKAVSEAKDPERLPMRMNFDRIVGSVAFDPDSYLLYVEKHDG